MAERSMTPEAEIVSELAEATCKRIARQVRIKLQRMTDVRATGDSSRLKNTWDELCVELQSQHSVFWSNYEAIVSAVVEDFVESLPSFKTEAIWLQTETAAHLRAYDREDTNDIPGKQHSVDFFAVSEYIIKQYVYPMATDWSNGQIRPEVERLMTSD